VNEQRWFCHGEEEWATFAERLKQMRCPHCKVVGTLIRHGSLHGCDENHHKQLRAWRVFCSNRNARPGCGRTFSVWLADRIRRLSLSAGALWQFLQAALAGSILAAGRALNCKLNERTWQRLWNRFNLAQSKIRTALCGCGPPPQPPLPLPATDARQPAAQVLAHLQAVFPDIGCPIANFQHTMHAFFV
jgi:hypothetical protein